MKSYWEDYSVKYSITYILLCFIYKKTFNKLFHNYEFFWVKPSTIVLISVDYSFSTFAKVSKKLYFLHPDTGTYVCISGGKNVKFFRKFCGRTKWMIPWEISNIVGVIMLLFDLLLFQNKLRTRIRIKERISKALQIKHSL